MRRGKTVTRVAVAAAVALLPAHAQAKKPRDDFFRPQPATTSLRLFGFFGPGVRATLDSRFPLEQDMSEVQTQVIGDANYGYSQASVHADVRVFLLAAGVSVGYRYDWHLLQFEPDTLDPSCPNVSEPCLDHTESSLTRRARWLKDHDYDWSEKGWPWYEGRLRLIAPMYDFFGISTFHFRYQDRNLDPQQAYDWEFATVFDDGLLIVNETFVVYKDRHVGFAGPTVRFLNVPRGHDQGASDREWEVHYGLLAGTQAGPSNRDLILFRFYTTLGQDNELMGTHSFRAPIQLVLGYQANLSLF